MVYCEKFSKGDEHNVDSFFRVEYVAVGQTFYVGLILLCSSCGTEILVFEELQKQPSVHTASAVFLYPFRTDYKVSF